MEPLHKSFESYGSRKHTRGLSSLSSFSSSSSSCQPADSHEDRLPVLSKQTTAIDPFDLSKLKLGLDSLGLPSGSKTDKSGGLRMLREPIIESWRGNEEEAPGEGLDRSPHQQVSKGERGAVERVSEQEKE